MAVFLKKIAMVGPLHSDDPSVYEAIFFAWALMEKGYSIDWFPTSMVTSRASDVITARAKEILELGVENVISPKYRACFFLTPHEALARNLRDLKVKTVFIPHGRYLSKRDLRFGRQCDDVWLNERLMNQLTIVYESYGWKYLQLQCGLGTKDNEESNNIRALVIGRHKSDTDYLRRLESQLCLATKKRIDYEVINLIHYEQDLRGLALKVSQNDIIIDLSHQDNDLIYMLASAQGKLLFANNNALSSYDRSCVIKFQDENVTKSLLDKVSKAFVRQSEREASNFWQAVGEFLKG